MVQGIMSSYRRGRKTYTPKHYIILIDGSTDKKKALSFIGKTAEWKSSSGKVLSGKIVAAHGCKGAVRAIFTVGLPGQAIGTKIEVK